MNGDHMFMTNPFHKFHVRLKELHTSCKKNYNNSSQSNLTHTNTNVNHCQHNGYKTSLRGLPHTTHNGPSRVGNGEPTNPYPCCSSCSSCITLHLWSIWSRFKIWGRGWGWWPRARGLATLLAGSLGQEQTGTEVTHKVDWRAVGSRWDHNKGTTIGHNTTWS